MRIQRILQEKELIEQKSVDLTDLKKSIEKYRGKKGNIIPLLQSAMAIYGYLPEIVFDTLEKELGISKSQMYGVATFYSQFRLAPVGKHIVKVCHGTACHVQNATALTEALEEALEIKDGETTKDGLFTIESVACLGCCSLAPVIMIGDEVYGKLDGNATVKIINEIKLKEKE
ncbi:MAG: NADH-quinone oxidoreductase subunit NuoE [Bacteroidales bacterium]|jgi:NADH-quinone oxidoreductase subunit E|nr:NADH-quinone oxidoreductase subunit NuoE [Bacteroidales bacterium]